MKSVTLDPPQELVRQFLTSRSAAAAYLGVGGGKTLTTLMTLSQVRPAGHILLIAPRLIARSSWLDEIRKWEFNLRTTSLVVNERDKPLTRAARLKRYSEVFTDPPTMYFINVELIHDLVENMPVKNGQIQWPFPTVIIDESQEFKAPDTRRFKAMQLVRPAIQRIIELTGTPATESLLNLWSQIYLLDQGAALGATYHQYLERYFSPSRTMKRGNRTVVTEWAPKPGAEQQIYQQISHLAIHVKTTVAETPAIHDINVTLPYDAYRDYEKFAQNAVLGVTTTDDQGRQLITAANAAVLHNKLLQYASGTIYTGADHARDFTQVHTEKLKMTDYVLQNHGGGNVIIAYRYQSDREALKKYLTDAGHQVEIFDGSRETIARWNRQEIPVLLLQPASARHGLNLQHGGHTLIWYTLPASSEHYQQTIGRLVRKGQTQQVQIFRLLTASTLDTQAPIRLEKKEHTQSSLLSAMRKDLLSHLSSMSRIPDNLALEGE